jgi:hypothetical protein
MADQIQDIRRVLGDAVATRGRYYAHHHHFAVRFQDDDIKAEKDFEHFQNILKLLGVPHAKDIILGRTPMWDWQSEIRKLCDLLDQEDGRKLLIFHYAGHGMIDPIDEDLHLAPSLISKRSLSFSVSFGNLYQNTLDFINTDVIIILDCCYSGSVTRGMKQADRSVEILAAVGSTPEALGNESHLVRIQKHTFTSRLADEVARAVGDPARTSIAFTEIIASLRKVSSPERLPEYFLRRGTVGIRLAILEKSRISVPRPMPSSGSGSGHMRSPSSSGTAPSASGLVAIFKIHVENFDSTSLEVAKLVEWIYNLHPSIGLELNGVFQGHSTEIFLLAPWSTWAVLNGLSGFQLLCEIRGQNRLQEILSQAAQTHESHKPRQQLQPQVLTENVPPHLRQNRRDS